MDTTLNLVYLTNKSLVLDHKDLEYKLIKNAAKNCNVKIKIVYSSDVFLIISGNTTVCTNKTIMSADAIIFNDKNTSLACGLESIGKKVFNSSYAIAMCDNKADMYNIMAQNNIPFLKTAIAPLTYSFKEEYYTNFVDNIIKHFQLPLIAKSFYGAKGKTIYKCCTKKDVLNLIKNKNGSSLLFQEYDENCAKENIRMNIIGYKYVSSVKRTSSNNEFRTNYSQGASLEKYIPSKEEIKLAERTAKVFKCTYCGIDMFTNTKNELMICEINSNAANVGAYQKTKINILENYINYIKKQL